MIERTKTGLSGRKITEFIPENEEDAAELADRARNGGIDTWQSFAEFDVAVTANSANRLRLETPASRSHPALDEVFTAMRRSEAGLPATPTSGSGKERLDRTIHNDEVEFSGSGRYAIPKVWSADLFASSWHAAAPSIQSYAMHFFGEERQARIAVSETARRAWTTITACPSVQEFPNWIAGVCRVVCRDLLVAMRNEQTALVGSDTGPNLSFGDHNPRTRKEGDPDFFAGLDALELTRALARIADPRDAAIFWMRLDGVKYPDIGKSFGMKESTARSVVFRVKNRLRVEIARRNSA